MKVISNMYCHPSIVSPYMYCPRSPSPDVEESLCFGLRKRVRKSRPRSPIVVQKPRTVLEKVPHFKCSVTSTTSTSTTQPAITRQQAGRAIT